MPATSRTSCCLRESLYLTLRVDVIPAEVKQPTHQLLRPSLDPNLRPLPPTPIFVHIAAVTILGHSLRTWIPFVVGGGASGDVIGGRALPMCPREGYAVVVSVPHVLFLLPVCEWGRHSSRLLATKAGFSSKRVGVGIGRRNDHRNGSVTAPIAGTWRWGTVAPPSCACVPCGATQTRNSEEIGGGDSDIR